MQRIADLHIHSKYSRACSPKLTLENIEATCREKGVDIIATGDFTFPAWFRDIKNELEEIGKTGLYKLKTAKDEKARPVKSRGADATQSQFNGVKFILSTELSLIYKSAGKVRRIHLVVIAPNIKAVEKLNKYLDKKYNIRSDGRPILGMSAEELIKICLGINKKFIIFPAHIWTPWFSVFGSKSGFNNLKECFGKYTKNIYAYETGLSSDPEMNWRLSALDNLTLLSNSDAHSLNNIAREANVFELKEVSYDAIYNVIKNKIVIPNPLIAGEETLKDGNSSSKGFLPTVEMTKKRRLQSGLKYTIEFYPEEGMYHFDGHRDCGISFAPKESKKNKNLCPKCKKPLVIGVMNRVEELADRKEGFKFKNAPGFKKLVELDKIIAEALNIKSRNSKRVQQEYKNLIKNLGTELHILIEASLEDVKKVSSARIAEGVKRVREGKLIIKPGFDGQYGEVRVF